MSKTKDAVLFATLGAVCLPVATQAWMFPVSSPIMSLPTIETSSPTTRRATAAASIAPDTGLPYIEEENDTETTSLLSKILARKIPALQSSTATSKPEIRKVFCDLDGVLVDFESGIRDLFPPEQEFLPQLADLERSTMWKSVTEADSFFENLSWTSEGRALWEVLQPWQPDILTGIPHVHPSARAEKMAWCQRELGVSVRHVDKACPWTFGHRPTAHSVPDSKSMSEEESCQVITCWSSNKHFESGPGMVLIDDREALREGWERKGGIFIHHQPGDLEGTLKQLEHHNLLS